jgi:hypothetical protein
MFQMIRRRSEQFSPRTVSANSPRAILRAEALEDRSVPSGGPPGSGPGGITAALTAPDPFPVSIVATSTHVAGHVRGPNGFPVLAVNTIITLSTSPSDPAAPSGPFTYLWSVSFNGAAPSVSNGSFVTLTTPGRYSVTVQVTDSKGNTGTASGTYTVPPVSVPAIADAGRTVVGADAGAGADVRVFNRDGSLRFSFDAFPGFTGGVRVAVGDVTGDGFADIIVGAGAGAPGGHVEVFDGITGAPVRSFFAFDQGFTGGVFVGAGDVTGDGFADIIVGAGAGAPGGHVEVFDGISGALVRSFLAFPGFAGGVTVAGGDVTGDRVADIVVGAGPGAPGGHTKVFDGSTGTLVRSFLAFPGFTGGVFVGTGDVTGDGRADVIVGAGAGAPGGHVEEFDGATGAMVQSFMALPGFTGGVRVAAADVNADGLLDVVGGAGPGAGPRVQAFSGSTQTEVENLFGFDPAFAGGVFVA